MPYKWLLFDVDNTLLDFDQTEALALEANFTQHGLAFPPEAKKRYHQINKSYWQRLERKEITPETLRTGRFHDLFDELAIRYDAIVFANTYLANLGQQAPMVDGAMELLTGLNGRFQLGIITNGLADVQHSRLEKSGLKQYFSPIIISQEIGSSKPNPDIFDAAFAQMNQPTKSDVLIIGDSLSSDMVGGINYGIDTCWFNPNGKTTDLPVTHEISQLNQLSHVLNGTAV
ncbi:YjjG family noncanonical pyrimidine nucleotidase [Candidatus Leptofilum sp.]|uniref:YjjG family noncanonical pyrimidine nucleotidase n=1 Tax=Candidatus Leptofilum sp. TaxID=3241576 RepID=UPI003B5CF73F